jgi:hypothetical protein
VAADPRDASEKEQLELTVSGQHLGTRWSLVSKGAHLGGTILASAALFYDLRWTSPLTNPQDFVLTMITTFCAGAILGAWIYRSKVDGLEQDKAYLRREVNRMAEHRLDYEKSVLRNRLTSEKTKK